MPFIVSLLTAALLSAAPAAPSRPDGWRIIGPGGGGATMATRSYREGKKLYWDRKNEAIVERPPT